MFQSVARIFLSILLSISSLEAAITTYAQCSSLTTQVPKPGGSIVKMDVIEEISNLELNSAKDKVIIKEDGLYFIISVGQVGASSTGVSGNVNIWISKNGVAIPNSASQMTVEHSAWTGTIVAQTLLSLKAGDTIATHFSATGPSLGFIFSQPKNEPASASIGFSIFKID